MSRFRFLAVLAVTRGRTWRSRPAATTTTVAAAAAVVAAAAVAAARSRCSCPSRRRLATSRRTGRNFENKVKELCSDCEILYSNADQDAAKQQQQAEAALTKGAKVLVLDPVDAASAGAIVNRAKQSQIPVVSYDRLITDADIDYYISFDNEKVGKLQGESLVDKLKDDGAKGDIVMINGAPTDNNAKLFKQGAHSVIDGSEFKVAQGVRHARLEPGQGPAGDGAGDHRARQGRLRGRLRRQRRHRRRRDRGDEGAPASTRRRARRPVRTPSSPRSSGSSSASST